jgi:hypothetical protein
MHLTGRATPENSWSYKTNPPTLEEFIYLFTDSRDQTYREMANKVLHHHRSYRDFNIVNTLQMSQDVRNWRERVVDLTYNRRNLRVHGIVDEYGMIRLTKGIDLLYQVAIMYSVQSWK